MTQVGDCLLLDKLVSFTENDGDFFIRLGDFRGSRRRLLDKTGYDEIVKLR